MKRTLTDMNRTLMVLIVSMLSLMVSSCGGDSPMKKKKLEHYVTTYALEVEKRSSDMRIPPVVQDINVNGLIRIMLHPTKTVTWKTENDKEREEYLKYARKNNDLAWNKEVYPLDATELKAVWFRFTSNQVVDISITAESDWDIETPKGSSLDDRFLFLSGSPDEYLKNGYKLDISKVEAIKKTIDSRLNDVLEFYIDQTLQTSLPVYGVLSEINFLDYQLLGFGKLWFSLMPIDELTKGADISINIKFDNGKVVNYKHKCK